MDGIGLDVLKQVDGWRCVQDVCAAASVTSGFTSDLLSDVVAHAPAGSALITLQAHLNTVAVAALVGVAAIVICGDRPIPDDMREAAVREKILILLTDDNQFQASVKLHQALASGHA
jgi:hypothetical protein